MNDVLQELSSTSETDDDSGEESGAESGGEENKKEEEVDEDDEVEKANLPQYVLRFKVGVCCGFVCRLQLNFQEFSLLGQSSKHCFLLCLRFSEARCGLLKKCISNFTKYFSNFAQLTK